MKGFVFVQNEEEYEKGKATPKYSIRIAPEGLRCLCEKLKDHIEDYPNYHFRLKNTTGQNYYLCLHIK